MRIIVASTNPVKIEATRQAFQLAFATEDTEVQGVSVPSHVSDQPMTDVETLQGAVNRTKGAYLCDQSADYWVGIEGGIEMMGHDMTAFAWVVVRSRTMLGKGKSGTFLLPPQIVELINQGYELGEADDRVFHLSNSKQNGGAVGRLTHGIINRTDLYTHAAVLALIPFQNISLYVGAEDEA